MSNDFYVPGAAPRTTEQQAMIDQLERVSEMANRIIGMTANPRSLNGRIEGLRCGNPVKPREMERAQRSYETLSAMYEIAMIMSPFTVDERC